MNLDDYKANLEIEEINAPDKACGWAIKPIEITDGFIELLRREIADSYLPVTTLQELYRVAGMDGVFEHLRTTTFPSNDKTLKGNFGEILCQTYVKACTDFEILYPKLRLRFAKEPSPHGEDVLAFIFRDDGLDELLVVEAKLRTGSVKGAIKKAHDTIEWCVNGQSECFLLHQILSFLEQGGDDDKYHRINTMLTDYHGDKFNRVGAIFIVTPLDHWEDSYFIDNIEDNQVDPLWCWAFVVEDVEDLIERTH